MATAFEEAITKAVQDEVVSGAAVIAVDKTGMPPCRALQPTGTEKD